MKIYVVLSSSKPRRGIMNGQTPSTQIVSKIKEKKKAAVKSLLRTKVKKHNNILLKEGRNTVRQKIRTRFFFSPEIDG